MLVIRTATMPPTIASITPAMAEMTAIIAPPMAEMIEPCSLRERVLLAVSMTRAHHYQ